MEKAALKKILEVIKQESFTTPEQVTDAEAMGILISKYFEWDGWPIAQAAFYALEDANYHGMAEGIADQWEHATNQDLFKD